MKLMKQLGNFIRDERGQSTTEYILILSVVVMIAMKFKGMILERLTGMIEKIGGQMDEAAKSDG